MKTKVKPSELSAIKMVAGNEKRFTRVIDGGIVKFWIGFGWVGEGPAKDEDYNKYPVVDRQEHEPDYITKRNDAMRWKGER